MWFLFHDGVLIQGSDQQRKHREEKEYRWAFVKG